MFRMKFQSTVESTSGDEEDERTGSVYRERFNGDAGSSGSSSPESALKVVHFQGRAGKFGKIRPLPTYDKTLPHSANGYSSLRSMILSPNVVAPGSQKRADIDLVNLEGPPRDADPPQQATVVLDGSLLANDTMTDKTTIVEYLHWQTSTRGQDSKMVFVEAPCAVLEARTASSRSKSSECSSAHSNEEESEAMTEMINKLMQERRNLLQTSNTHNDDKFATPWQEPLLAAHDQDELDLMVKEEAKTEAKRLVEEERLERERHLRELRDLANCVVRAPSPGRTFKSKSKLKKILGKVGVTSVYRFLKSPFRIFRSHKKYTEYPNAREAKVIIPKARLFSGCRTVPSGTTASQLAMMRNAPQPRITRRPNIQFATVQSTQRDVPAWTREEYLRKNGRIPERSTNKKEDQEFGGIEGNNLMNQYFDDGVVSDYDSDSD